MYIETIKNIAGQKQKIWEEFLKSFSLDTDMNISETVLIFDDDTLIATGSRQGNILKCIAVDPSRQGEDLTSKIITPLRQSAFEEGFSHLFLYTKPENKYVFSSLFFYEIAKTDKVLLMENRQDGISSFINSLKKDDSGKNVGACVMNCNPFTLGHRYLIETASKQCDLLYVFVVSEDKSEFSFKDRFEMVKRGCEDLKNVRVLETGPYLISSATFPTYFLKDKDNVNEIQCMLDIEIFSKYYAPHFSITKRFVGTEPLSPSTDKYNQALKKYLPQKNIELIEVPRLETKDTPISASKVRKLIKENNFEALQEYLPKTTLEYIKEDL